MIQITPQHNIFIYVPAIDFRVGIDGLIGVCLGKLKQDPFSGTVFVFRNSRKTAVKILVYDGTGFWLMHKRFSQHGLKHWPDSASATICATNLIVLLNQGTPAVLAAPWRKVPTFSNMT